MDFPGEERLAAGLLSALVSVTSPSPTPSLPHAFLASAYPLSTPTPTLTPTPTPSPSPGYGDGEKERIREWSSLIGICTALAGNVLISVALNIQRYAHVRINKEQEHDKVRMELDWKRGSSGRMGPYGAVATRGEEDARGRAGGGHRHRYRDESPDENAHLHDDDQPHIQIDRSSEDGDRDGDGDGEGDSDSQHRLRSSIASDRTVRPDDHHEPPRKSYLRSPYWWAGIILMCLGEVGNFLAYGFAPASIVSPLGVVALISNCVIAPFMLKETFRKRDLWGVLVAIAGAVVVVLSAKSSEEKIGPHDIWVMITRWEFELYLGISAVLIVGLMWASGRYGQRTILIDVGLVALFGGYTALSTKGVSSLLSFTLWHVITFPITYLLVFVLVFSALMQIRYINRALQRFDSTQVIPTQFVLFTLSVIIGSAVLYQDFRSFTPDRAGKFVGGCLLTFLGVYFLTSGRVRSDDESTYAAEDDDEEEAIGLLGGGERYRDRVDLSPPGVHSRVAKPGQKVPEPAAHDDLASPSGSLLSRGIDGIDGNDTDDQLNRGISSAAPSSPVGSLTADSLSHPEPSSPFRAPSSFMTNPWAEPDEQQQQQTVTTPLSEPQIRRPATPPAQTEPQVSDSVMLRFPSAPGAEERTPQDSSSTPKQQQQQQQQQQTSRTHPPPQTPPSRRLRTSIGSRFSPGPLLPTFSAGFSAVVAESLRRGEMSPAKERRGRHRASIRGKQPTTTILDGYTRSRDDDVRHDLDTGAEANPNNPFAIATARLHSTGDLPTVPGTGGIDAPVPGERDGNGNGNGNDLANGAADDVASESRVRSLSDSWSGAAWLGEALHRHSTSAAAGGGAGNEVPESASAVASQTAETEGRSDAGRET